MSKPTLVRIPALAAMLAAGLLVAAGSSNASADGDDQLAPPGGDEPPTDDGMRWASTARSAAGPSTPRGGREVVVGTLAEGGRHPGAPVRDLTAVGTAGGGDAGGIGGADDFKGGPGCSIQCITSGVAYARGIGAELVVKTDTAARIWIYVWTDDGYHRVVDSGEPVQSFAELFDDLEQATSYYAMAAAEDAAGYTSYRWGTFQTLERNVEITLSPAQIHVAPFDEPPYNSDEFGVYVWLEGDWLPGSDGPSEMDGDGTLDLEVDPIVIDGAGRYVDLAVELAQFDPVDDVCEYHGLPFSDPSSGEWGCDVWTFATFDGGDGDLDDRPASATSWTEHTLQRTLVVPGGHDDVPLDFTVPVTLHVTYD